MYAMRLKKFKALFCEKLKFLQETILKTTNFNKQFFQYLEKKIHRYLKTQNKNRNWRLA